MKKSVIISFVFPLLLNVGMADLLGQGVGINPSGNSPDPSAGLDIDFSDKGVLISRMTTAQRNAISNPAEGLVIFNTDCKTFNYNAGTSSVPNWVALNSSNSLVAGVSISATPIGAICEGSSVTFTATPSSGLLSPDYQWKVNGENIGTNSISFVTSELENGDVVTCVLSSSEQCVTGSPASSNSIVMVVNPSPVTPGIISGTSSTCSGDQDVSYSIAAVAGASSYNWSLPAGASITSGNGSNSITVTFGSFSGNVGVSSVNGCGISSQSTFPVSVSSTPAVPGAISGSSASCEGTSGNIYSISAVSGATIYTWSVPSGSSVSDGQGSVSSTVTFGSLSGNVSVTAGNSCGTSAATSLMVNVTAIPSTPVTITGSNSVCGNTSGNVYSISSVFGATSYTWAVPFGASINSGQTTASITVTYGSSSGNISVTADNSCGSSSPTLLAVTVNSVPTGSQTFNTTNGGFSTSGSIQSFSIPACVTSIAIEVLGAQGGSSSYGSAGKGARIKGQFSVTQGDVLNILVGNQGESVSQYDGGGGGGSFVWKQSDTSLLIAAGGGGGAGGGNCSGPTCVGQDGVTTNNATNGNNAGSGGGTGGNGGTLPVGSTWSAGGGGWLTNGNNGNDCSPVAGGGVRPLSGGNGGNCGGNCGNNGSGGFGGGGGAQGGCNCTGGGGGGGYSGGGPASNCYGGGGGGSYNSGSSLIATAGYQTGNGQVIITW